MTIPLLLLFVICVRVRLCVCVSPTVVDDRCPRQLFEALHPDWPAVAFEGEHRADLKRYRRTS